VQTGFALEVSLKLLVHEVSCPEGFTGEKCAAPVTDLFAKRRGDQELGFEFMSLSGKPFADVTSSIQPVRYVRFRVDDEMVGGLLELELHCHHSRCHRLKMTPSHLMTTSGLYGKTTSDHPVYDNGNQMSGIVLTAASRFPTAGWWYVAVEGLEGAELSYELHVRIKCAGDCHNDGVCRLQTEAGFVVGLCHCTHQYGGDNCNTSLYHLVILVVQIVALGVSPLAMGPVIRFCFAKGLVTEATIYLIYSLASIGRYGLSAWTVHMLDKNIVGVESSLLHMEHVFFHMAFFVTMWWFVSWPMPASMRPGGEKVSMLYFITMVSVQLLKSGMALSVILGLGVLSWFACTMRLAQQGKSYRQLVTGFTENYNTEQLGLFVVLLCCSSLCWYLEGNNDTFFIFHSVGVITYASAILCALRSKDMDDSSDVSSTLVDNLTDVISKFRGKKDGASMGAVYQKATVREDQADLVEDDSEL